MSKVSFHILRVGIAITFLWIGVLIFQNPEAWGSYLAPWLVKMLPVSVKMVMLSTAVLDVVLGFFLLINSHVWLAGLVGSIHLILVLISSGINEGTVRDIGLLAGMIALAVDSYKRD
jgi:uncharacterized membrane protein YkgB